jgi:hypothetical protein
MGEKKYWQTIEVNPHELIALHMMRWALEHPDGNVREGMLKSMEASLVSAL